MMDVDDDSYSYLPMVLLRTRFELIKPQSGVLPIPQLHAVCSSRQQRQTILLDRKRSRYTSS